MSLKAFHIFFITAASAISVGCGVWGFKSYFGTDAHPWQLWFGIGGVLIGIALIIYGCRFLKKMKNVSYL